MNIEKLAILLVNLGSPRAPERLAVKNYLREFLSDKRVVDLPRALWLPILYGVILNIRPPKVARAYKSVWQDSPDSPLVHGCKLVKNVLNDKLEPEVFLAMRYGEPSIKSALNAVMAKDTTKLVVLPMFPQFSSATSASIFDAVSNYFKDKKNVPSINFIRDYHEHPLYIKALAESIRKYWRLNSRGEKFIISFHGLPQRYVDKGDPYKKQCETTAKLLGTELGVDYILAFQSRFGKEPWLQPYFDKTLLALAKDGVKSVDVISPGFSVDCLETLEELAIVGKQDFIGAGGKKFNYIPALNSSNTQIELFKGLIGNYL